MSGGQQGQQPTQPGGQQGQQPTKSTDPKDQQKAVEEGVKDVTSGLADALKGVGVQNTQAIQAMGTLIVGLMAAATATGVGAIVVGVVGAVGSFVGAMLPLLNQGADQTQNASAALVKLVQDLLQADAAQAHNTRANDIQDQMANANKVRDALKSLSNQLPLPQPEVTTQLENIIQAIEALKPADVAGLNCQSTGGGAKWEYPFNFQVFWNDLDTPDNAFPPLGFPDPFGFPLTLNQLTHFGYDKQAPKPDANNNVFCYTTILPAYMYSISVFLTVGVVIDPKFTQNWGDTVIRPSACLLQSVHDFILNNGITQLSPGFFNDQSLSALLLQYMLDASDPNNGLQHAQSGVVPALSKLPFGLAEQFDANEQAGLSIEYGAVEKFSGFSSMGTYTLLATFVPNQGFRFPGNIPYFLKFQIRQLRRFKDVYAGCGLLHVWDFINNLKKLVGDTPLPGPSLADWWFRRDLAKIAPMRGDGSFSLRDMQNFIMSTPPAEPQRLITSIRGLLSV
jgi:hypothetical protein